MCIRSRTPSPCLCSLPINTSKLDIKCLWHSSILVWSLWGLPQQTGSTGELELCHTASRTDACWPELQLVGSRLQRLSALQQAGRRLSWKSITGLPHPLTRTPHTTHASPWLLPFLQQSLLVLCVEFLLFEWVPASIQKICFLCLLYVISCVHTWISIWWTEFHLLKSE